jgi:hypothetical protein
MPLALQGESPRRRQPPQGAHAESARSRQPTSSVAQNSARPCAHLCHPSQATRTRSPCRPGDPSAGTAFTKTASSMESRTPRPSIAPSMRHVRLRGPAPEGQPRRRWRPPRGRSAGWRGTRKPLAETSRRAMTRSSPISSRRSIPRRNSRPVSRTSAKNRRIPSGALVGPLERGRWRHQLDVLGAAGEITVDVAGVDRRDRLLDDIHVVLRHAGATPADRRPRAPRRRRSSCPPRRSCPRGR